MQIHHGWRLAAFDHDAEAGELHLDLYYGEESGTAAVTLFVGEEEFEMMQPRVTWWLDQDVPLIVMTLGNIISVREEDGVDVEPEDE